MSAVVDLVRRRLARRAGVWIAVGLLLGAGFGLSFAAFNTARGGLAAVGVARRTHTAVELRSE